MKVLLIFPPVASPISPYLSTPLLCGQLIDKGFDASSLDLSVEFFHHILNPAFLKSSYEKSLVIYEELCNKEGLDDDIVLSEFNKLSYSQRLDILRKKFLKEYLPSKNDFDFISSNILDDILAYKNRDKFYDLKTISGHLDNISKALNIAMLPYMPAVLKFHMYKNYLFDETYDDIKFQVNDVENNIFYKFYKQKILEHNIDQYDLICISLPNYTQFLPALTLCKVLREETNAKLVIGGNIINRLDKQLIKLPEIFDDFIDFALIGCGENSLVDLAFSLRDNKNYSRIKGLIYKHNTSIKYNTSDVDYDISHSAMPSLKGLNLNSYFTPDIIFPIQATKGCYWGKCVFCGLHYPKKKYSEKTISQLVDEIEYLNKTYNISHFEFVDEALKPEYLSLFADEIINRKLDIKYYICSRIEKNFSFNLCKKLKMSGLQLVQFGYETQTKRIFKKINKGIDYEGRLELIKNFADNDIWTYLYSIIGYPTETENEALNTVNLKKNYPDIIDSMFVHNFWLDKKAPIYKKYLLYGILRADDKKPFSQVVSDFISLDIMSKSQVDNILNINKENNKQLNFSFFSPDEYFFLYVSKWGKNLKNILKEMKV